jgi:hypothetical protein
MTAEDLRKYRNAEPFQPFHLWLKDGRRILIREPENIGWSPSGRRVAVYGEDDLADSFDIDRVVRAAPVANGSAAI